MLSKYFDPSWVLLCVHATRGSAEKCIKNRKKMDKEKDRSKSTYTTGTVELHP